MILWHLGLTTVIVWAVFSDPRMDFRFVAVGALLPDLVDLPWGRPAIAHTLLATVGVLAAVMLATTGSRAWRRCLLPLVIGMFLHLVLDGMWADRDVFLWPAFGSEFPSGSLWPSPGAAAFQELVGALALWWVFVRFGLRDPARRRRLWREGRLEPVSV